MLRATELSLVCATVVAVAQNKLTMCQLQGIGPRLSTENIIQAFASSQLCRSGTAATHSVLLSSSLCRACHHGCSWFKKQVQLHKASDCGTRCLLEIATMPLTFVLPLSILGFSGFWGSCRFCSCLCCDIYQAMWGPVQFPGFLSPPEPPDAWGSAPLGKECISDGMTLCDKCGIPWELVLTLRCKKAHLPSVPRHYFSEPFFCGEGRIAVVPLSFAISGCH